jgi:DNA polymerase (family 10)
VLINSLLEINGIGLDKAKQLISLGLTNISQLKREKYFEILPIASRAYVVYKPVKKIPNKTIVELSKYLITNHKTQFIVGSFRRGKPFSKDIDLMIVSDVKGYLDIWLQNFEIIFSKKNVVVYAKGAFKISMLIRHKSDWYKIDVFQCRSDESVAMLLYSTGSKEFNISMRSIAKKKGYILNQKGLFDQLSGRHIDFKTEQDVFKFLNIPYLLPQER